MEFICKYKCLAKDEDSCFVNCEDRSKCTLPVSPSSLKVHNTSTRDCNNCRRVPCGKAHIQCGWLNDYICFEPKKEKIK